MTDPRSKVRAPGARVLATRVLRDVERGAFSNRALSDHLERWPSLPGPERGLTTTLVYGVLRHRARLDRHIDTAAHKPAGIKGELRDTLRIAAFELLELGRDPAIAIAEARKATAALRGGSGLQKVVQAVLSGIVRDAPGAERELDEGNPLDRLERRWSIPRWLAGRWLKQLGPDVALRRAELLASAPPVDLRVDLTRTTAAAIRPRLEAEHPGIEVEEVDGQPQALRVRRGGDLFYGPLHDEGLISVQGLGAQQAVRLLAPTPGGRVLDACAGMGVKTLQLAEAMQRRGTIVAADADAAQLSRFSEVQRRGRLTGADLEVQSVHTDVAEPHPLLDTEPFDAVLLDVPCTGLGNLARHPEIRWQRRFEDIASAVPTQRRLLARCRDRVRAGGLLAYAVCSLAPEEGPDVVAAELAEYAGWQKMTETAFTPEDDGTEGFYVALLRRR